jgi:hypothetical protein
MRRCLNAARIELAMLIKSANPKLECKHFTRGKDFKQGYTGYLGFFLFRPLILSTLPIHVNTPASPLPGKTRRPTPVHDEYVPGDILGVIRS